MDNLTRSEFQIYRETVSKSIQKIENSIAQIHELAASVRELAASVKQIAETQEKQNDKIDNLQNKDGEMWRKLVSYAITAIAGAVIMQALKGGS